MKKAILLAILLPLAATASFAQDNANAVLTQCRDLADAGNFVGPDEVLVNGKVCKVQKTAPTEMQDTSAGNHLETPSATATAPPMQTQTPGTSTVATSSDPPNSNRDDGAKSVQPVAYRRSATTSQKPAVTPNSPIATVTFITIQNGNVVHLMPDWAIKWVRKNEKKYPGVRFQTSDKPVAGAKNFVVAFSASSAELQGFQPVTHTDTSTDTSPMSGNGTVTDNQGEMWNYTYNGTVTTTTTTTTDEQVPYTRTSNTLYVTAFNEQGETVAQRWHVYSTQSGGDSANALGYNLGNALGAINARGHMLKTIVDDLVGKGK
ncbi:MAG: hypothetical protein WAL86_03550 [Candidatus Acidiferrales bacterium]